METSSGFAALPETPVSQEYAGIEMGGLSPPPPEIGSCVRVEGLHKTYMLGVEGVAALRGVSLEVSYGEFVMILGTSGGGKTSLLNLIGTIDVPTRGSVSLCGSVITERTQDTELARLRLHKIGFVFQAFNLLPSLTALENVEVPMRLSGELSSEQRRARAMALLEQVGLAARADHKPSQLSGGEQQRVTIARALANSPTLLLLDEPTGDLDSRNSDYVMQILIELNRGGMAMAMVTHDVGLKQHAHRVVHMSDGKVSREEIIPQDERTEASDRLNEACQRHRNEVEAAEEAETELVVEHRTALDYDVCRYNHEA